MVLLTWQPETVTGKSIAKAPVTEASRPVTSSQPPSWGKNVYCQTDWQKLPCDYFGPQLIAVITCTLHKL